MSQTSTGLYRMTHSLWKNNSARKLFAAFTIGIAAATFYLYTGTGRFPSFEEVRAGHAVSEGRLLDRHGKLLQVTRRDFNRRALDWTPLDDISPALIDAVISAEDRKFKTHSGVNWLSVGAAAKNWFLGGPPRGASTISMQLAGFLDSKTLSSGFRGLLSKFRQIAGAMALERSWSKEQILEAYLNIAGFRAELIGVQAMSIGLFGKRPGALDSVESMIAAALLRSPRAEPDKVAALACFRAQANNTPQLCEKIQATVAFALDGTHYIPPDANYAPHLVKLISPKAGQSVKTTLDSALQKFVTGVLDRNVSAIHDKGVRNAAAVVVDNRTGEVLAYAGNVSTDTVTSGIDGVRANRQAGSALKPFLYALAIDRRLITAATLIEDTPLETAVRNGIYRPENYDNIFRGLVPARMALANSLNIPAVRLAELTGPDDFVSVLEKLGLTYLRDGEHYGASVALGSPEVKLIELVNAYRVLANGGVWQPLKFRPEEAQQQQQKVFSPEAAFIVADILSDRGARGETFGLENPLATTFWSAVKTGTSKDMRDNWCVGFTQKYTVGVWAGNFSGEPMHDVSGVSGAAPAWMDIITKLDGIDPGKRPAKPQNVTEYFYTDPKGVRRHEYFLRGTEITDKQTLTSPGKQGIDYPIDGEIMAVDPDIPAENQVVIFSGHSVTSRDNWRLNGKIVAAGNNVIWKPVRGKYLLELVAVSGTVADTVNFVVK